MRASVFVRAFVLLGLVACGRSSTGDPIPEPAVSVTATAPTVTAAQPHVPVAKLPGPSGFSKDGKSFVYVDSGLTGLLYKKVATVGEVWPKASILDGDL